MLLTPCMFLKIFSNNALCDTIHITHVKTIRSLSTQVASSGSYYNKDAQANMPIYVLFSYKLYFICCFRVVYMVSVYKNSRFHFIQSIQSGQFIPYDVCWLPGGVFY
jgi:hypothetical protein